MTPATSKKLLTLLFYQKYLGIFLILIGIPILIFVPPAHSSVTGPEWPLLIGLYTLFFSRERVEDERSATLRSFSLMIAFISGYVIELISTYLYTEEIIGWHLTQIKHFIILVLALATVIFYWTMNTQKVQMDDEKYP